MKKLGAVLLTLCVIGVAGVAFVSIMRGIAWNYEKQGLISITEARALVNKVCTACGLIPNSVSTASLNTQSDETNDTENNNATSEEIDYDFGDASLGTIKQFLAIGKFLVEHGDGNEGFFKATNSAVYHKDCYYAYRLTNKGVEIDWAINRTDYLPGTKIWLNISYADNNKESWKITCFLGEANGELKNIDNYEYEKGSMWLTIINGVNLNVLEMYDVDLKLNESLYSEYLSTNSVVRCYEKDKDYANRNGFEKTYGDCEDKWFEYPVQTFTNKELNQVLQSCHKIAVNAYSVSFCNVKCEEYDPMLDVAELLGLNY